MKYLLVSLVLFLVACNGNVYTLSGTTQDKKIEGKTVYLVDALNRNMKCDSAEVKKGRFRFKGNIIQPVVKEIYAELDGNAYNYVPVVLEPGSIIVVLDTIVYTGHTPLNEKMQDFLIAKSNFIDTNVQRDSLSVDFPIHFSSLLKEYILKNSDNVVGEYLYKGYSTKLTNEDKKEILERSDIALLEKIQRLK